MAEFKVPELGENVASGDVTRVLVNVGDTIARDQPVLELETDKATIEVPSSVAGKVTGIKVKKGDTVDVGTVILTVEEDGSGGEASAPDASEEEAGDVEEQAEPRQQQAAAPAEKKTAPAEKKAAAPAEKKTTPGEKVVSMPARGEAPAAQKPKADAGLDAAKPASKSERGPAAPAAPSVRRLAREIGVDIDDVQGTGAGGRISEADVKEHARRILASVGGSARTSGEPAPSTPLPDFAKWGEIERQPMSSIRRKTAEHLSHAWNAIPHVTQFDKADITAMEELRKSYREQVASAGGNLTVTAMLVKVIAAAVKQFPQFNASLDTEAQEIVFKKYVNVGVAVDTDRGLLVPVIRDADRKNITQIAIEVHQAAEKARDRKLSLEEMRGGGITISNLGGIGGTYFTPIVNWPEVAILGVSRGIIEPAWRPAAGSGHGPSAGGSGSGHGPSTGGSGSGHGGTFEPRQILPLALSYDHRVVDGADAARFLRWVVEAIEQPFLLSLLA